MTIFIFIFVLAVDVLVHEAGHFLTARAFGLRVYEFGLGFPPRLFGWKRKNGKIYLYTDKDKIQEADKEPEGTVYTINALPLGGFVRIRGEHGEDKDDATSFANRPVWQRSAVVVAGVLGNVVLAWLLISVLFMIGTKTAIPKDLPNHVQVKDRAIEVTATIDGWPAYNLLQPNDVLIKIDETSIKTVETLPQYVQEHKDQTMTLEISRDGQLKYIEMAPRLESDGTARFGIQILETGTISLPWYRAFWEGGKNTVLISKEIAVVFASLIADLFRGKGMPTELAGPVGIAVMGGQAARMGFQHLMQFMAILSLNLAIINILPFPALDGGRFLFLIIEKLRGKQILARVENAAHAAGFVLLMILVVLVTYRDIARYGSGFLEKISQTLGF